MKDIIIIGSGFSSLSASCYLAQQGYKVNVYEKNPTIGGRARQLKKNAFTFDIGPTWYWMPDVFERFFADFNTKPSDFYSIERLSPAYQVYFGTEEYTDIPGNLDAIAETFESIEPGSAKKLRKFLKSAQDNYNIAIGDLVYKPGISPLELVTRQTLSKLGLFVNTIAKDIRKDFKNEKIIRILEFPVLFLGAKPSATPAFYNFMNYADFGLGTWYPGKGMYSVVEGIEALARQLGVVFHVNAAVEKIIVGNGSAQGAQINGEIIWADAVLSGADYHHTETLLDAPYRSYSQNYWEKKVFAPSSLLFYVGFSKKLKNVSHHTLFFDTDFDAHAASIYDDPKWPDNPLFYASFPSKTDPGCAPEGHEAAIFLIPLAPGLHDINEIREEYFDTVIARMELRTGQELRSSVLFWESFGTNDFISDYNSYKGNAYGLANTLLQTAFLRPAIKSKKVDGLFFTGQLTVPGPGVPPALISGKIAAEMIQKHLAK